MRNALMFAAAVLIVGLCAETGFEAAFAPEPIPAAVVDGPYSRPSSKLLVSERSDRERRSRRSNQYLVTNRDGAASDTRRGLPPIGNNVRRHSR